MSILETQAPLLDFTTVSPSAASIRRASRTGSRLAPSCAATCSCMIRAPGRSSPLRMAARRWSATRWLATAALDPGVLDPEGPDPVV